MDIFQALILSIVEGLTEFLPISSTGHLVLASRVLNIPQTDFVKSFEIIIQLGAIMAVVFIYFKKLISSIYLWKIILAAFVPTAIIGFILYALIKNVLLGNLYVTVVSLIAGGIVLILFEKYFYKKQIIKQLDEISYKQALIIGLAQSVSIIPGVSRAGATIVGGLFLGLDRKTAVEFSFLLAIPTMFAATFLDLVKTNFQFSQSEIILLLAGLTGAFITAFIAVKFLLNFIQKNTFVPFGVYRIILGIAFWIIFLL